MRGIIFGCVLIALAAMAVPPMLSVLVAPPPAGAEADAVSPATRAPKVNLVETVELKAEPDGHFYVAAQLNSEPVRLMVDTGASVVALRQSDAEAAGIRVQRADFTAAVRTANGETQAAEVEIDRLRVDRVEIEGVKALVLPDERLGVSLLGGSFLNRLKRFEVAEGRLVLEN